MVKRGSFAALLGALFAVACDDVIVQPKVVQLKHDEPSTRGDGGHVIPPPECRNDQCCPKAAATPECYYEGKNPSEHSGAECMAQWDNTGKPHRQLRQTQSISVRPPGNKVDLLANELMLRSQLHSEACGTPSGKGGFIQLTDLDLVNGIGLTGFAAYVKEQSDALAQGLCFVEGDYEGDPGYPIATLYPAPAGWPKGLPPPQPLPWHVGPVRGKRSPTDFDVKRDREQILARFADGGDLKAEGYGSIFFLDEAKGLMHGYGVTGHIVTYDDATNYTVVPIREVEITSQLNDPDYPNCSGVFGLNELPTGCASTTATPAWSCPEGNCGTEQLGSTKVEGYFLIVEAEQVHVKILSRSLCYNMPGGNAYEGWDITPNGQGERLCRNNPQWNAMDPDKGIPRGDWCATTNSEATESCHDAWKSVSYSTFQAFPIQIDKTCPL